MGGVSKGLLHLAGKPLAAHVLQRMHASVDEILINANDDVASWQHFGYPVFADDIGGYAGPLAGVHGALRRARHPLLASLPCDTPFLPRDLISRLVQALEEEDAEIAVACTPVRTHPLCCVCRRELLPALERFLHSGGRSVNAWQGQQRTVQVRFDDENAFRNLNTPAELAQAAAFYMQEQAAELGEQDERI